MMDFPESERKLRAELQASIDAAPVPDELKRQMHAWAEKNLRYVAEFDALQPKPTPESRYPAVMVSNRWIEVLWRMFMSAGISRERAVEMAHAYRAKADS